MRKRYSVIAGVDSVPTVARFDVVGRTWSRLPAERIPSKKQQVRMAKYFMVLSDSVE
jgi:hypothetical protein